MSFFTVCDHYQNYLSCILKYMLVLSFRVHHYCSVEKKFWKRLFCCLFQTFPVFCSCGGIYVFPIALVYKGSDHCYSFWMFPNTLMVQCDSYNILNPKKRQGDNLNPPPVFFPKIYVLERDWSLVFGEF